MRYFLFIISVFVCKLSIAQTEVSPQYSSTVTVHKDPRIEMLIKKQSSINVSSVKSYGYKTRGYRLMVMNTNKRDEAIDAKTKVYTYFPELKAYLIYQAPFFRLKAGNFLTKAEAERYQKQLTAIFPKGVFVINDTVEIKGEKDSEED